ncbi:MAG: hypothetical protein ACJ72N_17620 [Labedaea sp.]
MTSARGDVATDTAILLKVLLKQRHLQGHRSFCREYDTIAAKVDPALRGSHPSRAQFYRWLSGELIGLPYADHCRILEHMFPEWTAAQLFRPYTASLDLVPDPAMTFEKTELSPADPPAPSIPQDVVTLYPHRAETPKELWRDLLVGAKGQIDLFANASLFLPEENPEAIAIIKDKAAAGIRVRILLGDPNHPAMELRGKEERLFEAIPGRIKMALAYYRPLVGVEGIEFRLHGTSLYNSIFRYDNHMLVNQHLYGTYGYVAPILHLRKHPNSDLFDTYMRSLELVWREESWPIPTAAPATL